MLMFQNSLIGNVSEISPFSHVSEMSASVPNSETSAAIDVMKAFVVDDDLEMSNAVDISETFASSVVSKMSTRVSETWR